MLAEEPRDLDAIMAENIKKYGWQGHYVAATGSPDEPDDLREGYVNYHTHGLPESLGQPDLQIVIPLPPELAHQLFWTFVDRMKAGETFVADQKVEKIIQDYPLLLKAAKECGRDVLRVVFPDKAGRFPGEPEVAFKYGRQLEVEVD